MTEIRIADQLNFNRHSLDNFDRFQKVTNVYRPADGKLKLIYHPFTETWSAERKQEKVTEVLSGKYITYCAFDGEQVIGMILLNPVLNENRMIVSSFHVSGAYRRHGIGRRLFSAAKAEALKHQAAALYLSACSAEETVNFYLAMGCRPSSHPIPAMAEDEPCDIQMEYDLGPDKAERAKALSPLLSRLWPDHTREELEQILLQYMTAPESAVFVEFDGELPVGTALCSLRHDYVEGCETSPVGYLEGIITDEDHRGHGIARKLVSDCENWARRKGCREFASDCELGNTESLAFHLSIGFKEENRIICFKKTL